MSRLTRGGTAEPVSRDQILRRKRGQGNINFPCSADHEQDWQPYPVDPYSCDMCDHTYNIIIYHNIPHSLRTHHLCTLPYSDTVVGCPGNNSIRLGRTDASRQNANKTDERSM